MSAKRSATKTKAAPASKAGKISAKPKPGSGKKAPPPQKGKVANVGKRVVSGQKTTASGARKAVAKVIVKTKPKATQRTSTSSKTAKTPVHGTRTVKAAKPAAKKTAPKATAPKAASRKSALKTVVKVPAKGPVKASKKVTTTAKKTTAPKAGAHAPAKAKAKTPAVAAKSVTVHHTKAQPAPVKPKAAKPDKHAKKAVAKDVRRFTAEELHEFYLAMLDLRTRLTAQVSELREQSLLRHDEVNQDEDGTDAFERVTSLDRASVDQSQINQINNAILAIEEGTYGLCDCCGEKIEKPRLHAVPFAKTCIKCQSEMEGDGTRRRPSMDLLD